MNEKPSNRNDYPLPDRLMETVQQEIFIGEGKERLAVLCAIEYDSYVICKDVVEEALSQAVSYMAAAIADDFNELEKTKV